MPMPQGINIPDVTLRLDDGSLIQHGPYNDRVYLMKPGKSASPSLAGELVFMARNKGYSKVFAKVPSSMEGAFLDAGYMVEARVPALYNKSVDGVFAGYFLDKLRSHEPDAGDLEMVLELALTRAGTGVNEPDAGLFAIRRCAQEDAPEMAGVYREVFESYPFPIHEPEYLLESMRGDVEYWCARYGGNIVALSSSEMDTAESNTEMTDFATLPQWRGKGLASGLLKMMEADAADKGLATAYTIARAASRGMNITFARQGYSFGGRLRNNTNISGSMESMNVWYKPVSTSGPR